MQYVDVRDLAEWMVRLIEGDASGTFNVVGPATKQTFAQFLDGLAPLAASPISFTWIEDYEWLKAYPLRKPAPEDSTGLTYAIPWVMPDGEDLGHTQISNRKAIAAGPDVPAAADHRARHPGLAAVGRGARGPAHPAALRPDPRAGDGDAGGVEGARDAEVDRLSSKAAPDRPGPRRGRDWPLPPRSAPA